MVQQQTQPFLAFPTDPSSIASHNYYINNSGDFFAVVILIYIGYKLHCIDHCYNIISVDIIF